MCFEEMRQFSETVFGHSLVSQRGVLRKKHTPTVNFFFFFFLTLVTGPRRSLRLKLSDTRVYEPQTRTSTFNALSGHLHVLIEKNRSGVVITRISSGRVFMIDTR